MWHPDLVCMQLELKLLDCKTGFSSKKRKARVVIFSGLFLKFIQVFMISWPIKVIVTRYRNISLIII